MSALIRAEVRFSESVGPIAALVESGVVILKAYASPDGKRIRIVVPEFAELSQAAAEPSQHWIEIRRKA